MPTPVHSGGDAERAPWAAAGKCWEALDSVGTLRDALCAALGQPKAAWCSGGGPPPRVMPLIAPPASRDLHRLRRICQSMHDVLTALRGQLGDPLSQSQPQLVGPKLEDSAASSTRGLEADERRAPVASSQWSAVPSQLSAVSAPEPRLAVPSQLSAVSAPEPRVTELQGVCNQLSHRARELEAPAARAADLERVAEKLRVRVHDLEAQEARTAQLRHENSMLRLRISELVSSQVQAQEEHKTLLAHVARLEPAARFPEVVEGEVPFGRASAQLSMSSPRRPLRAAP